MGHRNFVRFDASRTNIRATIHKLYVSTHHWYIAAAMKHRERTKTIGIVLLILSVFLAGCGTGGTDQESQNSDKTIRMGIVNWADAIAMSNLARVILEEEYDFTVETVYADAGVVFSSIAQGDNDLYLDMWLPVTHQSYMEEFGDDLTLISPTYEGARIGLVVPSYVSIDSIEDLNAAADRFDDQIVGIDTGAGIMQTTSRAIDEYDLDLRLTASSGPVMTAALQEAIDEEEWVVVTGWRPHWKFARWDLKFLEDPQGLYGEAETTYAVGTSTFEQDFPEVTAFLNNFLLSDSQLGGLMGRIADSDAEPYAVAREWVADHPELVEMWTETPPDGDS
mgnify:CR=1 FL=1